MYSYLHVNVCLIFEPTYKKSHARKKTPKNHSLHTHIQCRRCVNCSNKRQIFIIYQIAFANRWYNRTANRITLVHLPPKWFGLACANIDWNRLKIVSFFLSVDCRPNWINYYFYYVDRQWTLESSTFFADFVNRITYLWLFFVVVVLECFRYLSFSVYKKKNTMLFLRFMKIYSQT